MPVSPQTLCVFAMSVLPVLGSAPAHAAIISNALTSNSLTANAIISNSLSMNSLANNGLAANAHVARGVAAPRLSFGGVDGVIVTGITLPR